jgi:hypothetical protein
MMMMKMIFWGTGATLSTTKSHTTNLGPQRWEASD